MSFVRSKSTLTQRVIVALIGIPILLLAILLGGWLLLLVTMAITVAATTELLTLWRRAGAKAQRLVPLAAALLIRATFNTLGEEFGLLGAATEAIFPPCGGAGVFCSPQQTSARRTI